jgi:hypothetical protein
MFDKLKTKKISKGEFVRALSIAGITLLPQEADAITAKYSSPEFPDKMCYLDLCDDVNTVFVRKRLETVPPSSPVTTTPVPRFHNYIGVQSDEDEREVNAALARLRSVVNIALPSCSYVLFCLFDMFHLNTCILFIKLLKLAYYNRPL